MELPHPKFTRKGDNLHYVHKLFLIDAICVTPFKIETLAVYKHHKSQIIIQNYLLFLIKSFSSINNNEENSNPTIRNPSIKDQFF